MYVNFDERDHGWKTLRVEVGAVWKSNVNGYLAWGIPLGIEKRGVVRAIERKNSHSVLAE